MKAEIITIGDEILIGQIVDTNSAFIAAALNKIGVSVYQITSIQDEKQHILNAFKEAELRADIIIITGGLDLQKTILQNIPYANILMIHWCKMMLFWNMLLICLKIVNIKY